MRLLYFLSAAAALLILFLLRPAPISLAESPTPTPQPKSIRSPRTNQYLLYLPLIFATLELKKGMALTYFECASTATMNASWEYYWDVNPPNCPGVENIPMIAVAGDVSRTLGGNSQWIMGFNEPDSSSQANITPDNAAQLWRQIEQMYPTRKLLSPGTTGSYPQWLVSFRDAYIARYSAPPRLDGLAMHCFAWYANDCITRSQQFISWANAWGVPEVWVTEFSFAINNGGSTSGAAQQQQTFINWMVSQPKMTRYAWFASKIHGDEWWVIPGGTFNTPLVDWDTGQPTSFGNVYLPFH